jgi:protein TonB
MGALQGRRTAVWARATLGVLALHGLLLWAVWQSGAASSADRVDPPAQPAVLMLWRLAAAPAREQAGPTPPPRAAAAVTKPRGPMTLPPRPAPSLPAAHSAEMPAQADAPATDAAPAVPAATAAWPADHGSAPSPAPEPARPDSAEAPIVLARADHRHCPGAPYPAALLERGIEGAVRLRVRVDPEGRPAEVLLQAGSGWRLFDDAALQRARGCRFFPARRGGAPVESWVEFPVRFALNG